MGRVKPWVIVVIASLAFSVEFASMNIFNIINHQLSSHFHLNETQLGWMSSVYFLSNVLAIPIAGYLLDKWSPRWLLVISIVFSTLGISFLGYAPLWAVIGLRILSGACNPVTILGGLKISSRWLPEKYWGIGAGVVISMGMLGGLASQDPLVLLFGSVGWQQGLMWFLLVGGIVALLVALIVRDAPRGSVEQIKSACANVSAWAGLKLLLTNLQNWKAGLFTAMINTPLNILGGLWGVSFCQAVFHLSLVKATFITSLMFVGAAVGGPVLGILADCLLGRKVTMVVSALVALVCVLLLMFTSIQNVALIGALFFCLGLVISAQDLAFAIAKASNPLIYAGMSAAFVAFAVQLACFIYQPLASSLIMGHGMKSADYQHFIWLFPIVCVVALLVALGLKRREVTE